MQLNKIFSYTSYVEWEAEVPHCKGPFFLNILLYLQVLILQLFWLSVAAQISKHQYLTQYSYVSHNSTKTTICLLRIFSPTDIFIAFALGTAAAEHPA